MLATLLQGNMHRHIRFSLDLVMRLDFIGLITVTKACCFVGGFSDLMTARALALEMPNARARELIDSPLRYRLMSVATNEAGSVLLF